MSRWSSWSVYWSQHIEHDWNLLLDLERLHQIKEYVSNCSAQRKFVKRCNSLVLSTRSNIHIYNYYCCAYNRNCSIHIFEILFNCVIHISYVDCSYLIFQKIKLFYASLNTLRLTDGMPLYSIWDLLKNKKWKVISTCINISWFYKV